MTQNRSKMAQKWPHRAIWGHFGPILGILGAFSGNLAQKGLKRAQKAPKGPKGAKSAQNTINIARKLARKAKISTLGGTIMRVAGPCGSILV